MKFSLVSVLDILTGAIVYFLSCNTFYIFFSYKKYIWFVLELFKILKILSKITKCINL